jgi:hypothetical protein
MKINNFFTKGHLLHNIHNGDNKNKSKIKLKLKLSLPPTQGENEFHWHCGSMCLGLHLFFIQHNFQIGFPFDFPYLSIV